MTAVCPTVAGVVSALQLPPAALVNRRVPKKLLAERSPTASDRKLVQDNLEQVSWMAVLKPSNVGIAPFVDNSHEYLEVSVLSLELRGIDCESGRAKRLAELTHRAIPYPVMLLVSGGAQLTISLSHLRRAQDGTTTTVLEGPLYWMALNSPSGTAQSTARDHALSALEVGRKPWATLWHLYQGWIEVAIAWQAVPISEKFTLPASADAAEAMRQSVQRITELQQEIESLRRAARNERQIARLADVNHSIQQLTREAEAGRKQLSSFNRAAP